jgi:hypothetical protein
VAITGTHALVYTSEPEAVRTIFRDVFGFEHVDAGDGWLVFRLPPAELGVHSTEHHARYDLNLICDDIVATKAELEAKGIEFAGEPVDEGWGVGVTMKLPGGLELFLYEPRYNTAI